MIFYADPAIKNDDRDEDGVLYYTMEYTVKGPSFFRHNISKYAAASDTLYTYNAVCPDDKWDALKVMMMATKGPCNAVLHCADDS